MFLLVGSLQMVAELLHFKKSLILFLYSTSNVTFVFILFFLDDEEALNSIMKDLAALGRYSSQHSIHKPKNRTLLYKQVNITSDVITLHLLGWNLQRESVTETNWF